MATCRVSDTLHNSKLSAAGDPSGALRCVVSTSAASYSTPISRIADHFSRSKLRVTQVMTG
ncbi:hypothetical protein DYQ86_09180 [Acidobacteria bacterium AB60]|nr:hypothetical protein DYQ86_09180 [Acidobacteria bacterium AB60]